jgi:hypothetical protein
MGRGVVARAKISFRAPSENVPNHPDLALYCIRILSLILDTIIPTHAFVFLSLRVLGGLSDQIHHSINKIKAWDSWFIIIVDPLLKK